MKRDDVKAKIQGITEEQLDWLMAQNGADITREKEAAQGTQAQLEAANKTIADLKKAAKEFDGVNVKELQEKLSTLQSRYDTDLAAMRRDSAIELALTKARAKSGIAAKAMLDLEKIKLEDGKLTGLDEQLEALKKNNGWLFEQDGDTGMKVDTGGEHGQGGGTETDGVTQKFAQLNPNLKL